MTIKVGNQVFKGQMVCRECGEKHYPHPEKYRWMGILDHLFDEFITIPFVGECSHCKKVKPYCAFRLDEETEDQKEVVVTE